MRSRDQDYELLVELLKACRKDAGVSQAELADRSGDTQSFVSKVERGERRLDAIELIALLEALDVSADAWMKKFLQHRKTMQGKHSAKLKISS